MINKKRDDIVLFESDYRCYYCDDDIDASTSHELNSACVTRHVPKSKGGMRNRTNLVATCRLCAVLKGNLDVRQYSLEAVRKFINLKRKELHHRYNKKWAEVDLGDGGTMHNPLGHRERRRQFSEEELPSRLDNPEPTPNEIIQANKLSPEEIAARDAEVAEMQKKYGFKSRADERRYTEAKQALAECKAVEMTDEQAAQIIASQKESDKLKAERDAKEAERIRKVNEERRAGNADAKVDRSIERSAIDELLE